MREFRGKYALVQFCPIPERMEYINVGLILSIEELEYFRIRFVEEPKRVERLFGKQSKAFFEFSMKALAHNVGLISTRDHFYERMSEYSDRRANQVRITNLLDVRIEGDPDHALDRLFDKLVYSKPNNTKPHRARTRLRKTFTDFGVERALDKPGKIEISEYDIEVSAPYAYQNGRYNVIDAISLSGDNSHDLREVGKKAFEGNFLSQYSPLTRPAGLVIVADFSVQTDRFYYAVDEHFRECQVKLYRYDHIDLLVDDIQKHVQDWIP